MSEQPSFFAELKRRNVIRAAGLYLVGAWLLTQIASTVLPAFDVPSWALRALIVTLALGFIPALIFSWIFELTPQGLKRDAEVAPGQSIAPQTARRMDRLIIAVLAFALAYFCFDKWVLAPRREAAPAHRALLPNDSSSIANAKSIAVLPFESLSEDKSNAYFADGIQDEILARLSKIADLKVISRTSTQKYKSTPNNLREIAQQLGVANILEGSVQKSADQVRITVQLINAVKDDHLWADTYDRKLIDVFSVESDVAQKIASSLEAKLTGREKNDIAEAGTKNAEAYDAFLHSLALSHSQSPDDTDKEREFLRRAVKIDPGYAQAWARLGVAEANTYFGLEHTEAQLERARMAAETALRLAPDLAEAHRAMGVFHYYCFQDFDRALTELEIARERAPNDGDVLFWIALVKRRQGKLDASIEMQQRAARLDPLNVDIWVNLGTSYRGARRFDEARTMFDRALAIAHGDIYVAAAKADTYLAEGDLDSAGQLLEGLQISVHSPAYGTQVSLLFYRRQFDQALAKLSADGAREKDLPPILVAIYHAVLGELHSLKGDATNARPLLVQAQHDLRALREQGDTGLILTDVLIGVDARLGQRQEVEHEAEALLKNSAKDAWRYPQSEEVIARAHAILGDADRAVPLIQHALSVPYDQSLTQAFLRLDPVWDPIRNDPRFQTLAASPVSK